MRLCCHDLGPGLGFQYSLDRFSLPSITYVYRDQRRYRCSFTLPYISVSDDELTLVREGRFREASLFLDVL